MLNVDEVEIRPAIMEDASILSTLGRETFYEKWKGTTSQENMMRYLNDNYSINVIASELKSDNFKYLIAWSGKIAVGFARLVLAPVSIDNPESGVSVDCKCPMEISRIYVSPMHTGKSIGARLMHHIFETARHQRCDLIWLGVWEKNEAIRFYQRHGFIKAGTHRFLLGDQVDIDTVMVKRWPY